MAAVVEAEVSTAAVAASEAEAGASVVEASAAEAWEDGRSRCQAAEDAGSQCQAGHSRRLVSLVLGSQIRGSRVDLCRPSPSADRVCLRNRS
jgi:hypothetical protein